MSRRSLSRTNSYARYIPFGLFGGQISGVLMLMLALILIIMSSARPAWFDPTRQAVIDHLAGPLKLFSTPFYQLDQFFAHISSFTQMRAETENVREENRRLQNWYNVAQLLKAENQSLRSLLKVRINQSLSNVTVQVIGDTSGPYGQTIIIDAGENERLSKGDAVLGGEGLIGRILQVNPTTATILLMTDINSRIPVRIEGSNIQGILTGTGGQELMLTRLPEGSRANTGEQIVTSGIGGVFPPDLPVGTVQVQQNGRVRVSPFADFGRLLYVRVVRMRYDMAQDNMAPLNTESKPQEEQPDNKTVSPSPSPQPPLKMGTP